MWPKMTGSKDSVRSDRSNGEKKLSLGEKKLKRASKIRQTVENTSKNNSAPLMLRAKQRRSADAPR